MVTVPKPRITQDDFATKAATFRCSKTSVTRLDVIASFGGISIPVDALIFAFDAERQITIFDAILKLM